MSVHWQPQHGGEQRRSLAMPKFQAPPDDDYAKAVREAKHAARPAARAVLRDNTNRDEARKMRETSCLDHNIPLAEPTFGARPEFGPSIVSYYNRKHARGEFGKYFPLHLMAAYVPRDRSR